ncbi:MAG: DUF3285 domain-containing protein [Cyanobacteria bacterium]|nr:DUF3285 domain-containing protein [Cyanobacteriota bacterium]
MTSSPDNPDDREIDHEVDRSNPIEDSAQPSLAKEPEKEPTFVKLAMRNMVRKGGKSLFHFGLTIVGLLAVLVGLAYVTR